MLTSALYNDNYKKLRTEIQANKRVNRMYQKKGIKQNVQVNDPEMINTPGNPYTTYYSNYIVNLRGVGYRFEEV